MPSSPISIGKRPEFKYSKSAGWSWPRLVPIQDQQSRLSQASQPSASPSLPDHSEQEEQLPTMISPTTSKVDAVEDAPLSPVSSAAGRSPTAGESVTEAVNHQPKEHRHSISSAADSIPASIPEPDIEDIGIPIGRYASSLSLYAKGVAKNDDSEAADVSASAAERGPIEDAANQGGSQIPVVDESTITEVSHEEEKHTTPPTAPIPPVTDRTSIPSESFPYYATPKIMVHKASESLEAENQTSRTIDEVLANERQSVSQERVSPAPYSTPDGNPIDVPPLQPMSLTPIALPALKDQKVQKKKLYLRKIRNAAARSIILKITLGRQLATPTKQTLRLLANGENLTVPDLPMQGVEAVTMLVPQDAVGSVTGAVLLPQGVAGAVSDV